MWIMLPCLHLIVHELSPAFTDPSFITHCEFLLGWVMCLGTHTEYRVAQSFQAEHEPSRSERHPFDRYYNFFARSAWEVTELARHVAILAVVRLKVFGPLYLVVDDTLLHKRGNRVFGLGWFRDAVASTRKRVATASGNNWVVLALAVPIPLCPSRVFCIPLLMRLHLPDKDKPSCAALARQMLDEVLSWFHQRDVILIADAAYACGPVLDGLPERVDFVGRIRSDAAVYDPTPLPQPKSKPGRKPEKGPRLPSPKEAAARADAAVSEEGPWLWQPVQALAYGLTRTLKVLAYTVVWPHVLGTRQIRLVLVRDPEGKFEDTFLFTTKLEALPAWVIETFAKRWAIEVAFRDSKQVMDIEGPQHWCQQSIEKLAPWVWLMQGVILVWYVSAGHKLPEAKEVEALMGPWDSPTSLRHMLQVLRRATLNISINANSSDCKDLLQSIAALKNLINAAA
jgi:DDE superfamily endonuclease